MDIWMWIGKIDWNMNWILEFWMKTMVCGCIFNVGGRWLEKSWLGLNSYNGSCFEMLGFGYVLKLDFWIKGC